MDYSLPDSQQRHHSHGITTTLAPIRQLLQRSALARSAIYFGSAVLILDRASAMYAKDSQAGRLVIHLTALPFGALLTTAMYQLEGRTVPRTITPAQLRQVLQGAALGTSAFALLVTTAMAQGWISAPAWGWEQVPIADILRSLAAHGLGQLATAWNEEMVFRGYGLEVLSEALGQPIAIAVLIPLFAAIHPGSWRILLGQGMAGVTYTALRLASNDIWLPIGYHWAWNLVQTAVLGPADGMPSLRPLIVTGPEQWVGRPGRPEPGLLTTLVHAGMAVAIGAVGWFRKGQRY
jgi:membrane protease YdiL (CAAX protease family)